MVTVFSAYPGTGNIDHNSVKGTEILGTFAAGLAGTASGISSCLTNEKDGMVNFCFLLVSYEHATTMMSEFPTKKAVAEYLVKKATLPFSGYAPGLCKPPAEFGPVTPDTQIPRFTSPDQINIVVTGGPGKQSQIWCNFPTMRKPTSVLVEK